ncbi:hypothetical protein V8B55DRAFT_1454648 [Mucor lusitanicus]|uniref:SEL1 protein n=1 Tax=Mucor circinelloides f. lusitanicus TaxID=29924 RepID=A0A8H4F7E8_MUCCL|nr:hypothetical protein FB192DRAFT_1349266 [Mucor lusitanicus]
MNKQQPQNCWKKRVIYLTPFILGCVAQIVSAAEVQQDKQATFTTSIEKGNADVYTDGQMLYHEALKQLETIEKKYVNTTTHAASSDKSITDRIIHKIAALWSSSTDSAAVIQSPAATKQQQSKEFEAATALLEKSARDYDNNDALLLLAELNFFSKYAYPRNYRNAFTYYNELANKGNATAQQMIGFIYATGIGNIVERDQAKALLYHTFAAHGGDTTAEMTMGYRYLLGIGTDESCDDALYHYKNVASKVIDYYLSGPPGGHTPPLSKVRLSEEHGGVYGYGASVTTEKRSRHPGGSEKSVSIAEILQYWRYLAAKQDMDAQLMLGQVYYLGTRSIPRNFNEAYMFFHQIVDKVSPGGKIPVKHSKVIGQAAGYLGLMYWRGEGVKADENTAHKWFQLGVELGDSTSQNNLGMMYLDGIVVARNRDKAIEYFKKAADQENPNAQVNLAMEYAQSEASMPLAIRLFTKAADAKHLLAYWYLAHMNEQGMTPRPSCRVAVSYYKAIAERGDWLNPTVEDAYAAYLKNDKESALLNYMLAAERGYEVAQSNVAYVLDNDKKMLDHLPFIGTTISSHEEEEETSKEIIQGLDEKESAFIYWTRSANQNNVDSRVKMGDYYFKGIGTPIDFEKAVSCYRLAAETQGSPLAFWNLGWMYESGIGVAKDFHLAKRAYDQALNIDQDAYLPVKLSLIKMYAKYYWEWITGHEVGPALQSGGAADGDEDTVAKKRKVDSQKQYDIGEELERQYKMKKQKEREEQERMGEDGPFTGSDDDYNLDDYSEEDELFESLLILSLCLLVGYLVYVRQFRFGGNLRNGLANNPNENNNQ